MYYTDIATRRPLGTQTQARLRKHHKIILHTMVGSLWGTDSYFRSGGYSGTESHFGVGYDGEILQWQDDDYTADANLQGNDDCISIETADRGTGFPDWNTSGDNVPPWTSAQITAIAKIIAKVATRHGIPIVLITNTADSTKGIGYHRQGIDPYRTHGERYSTAFGKVCPGRRRIAQIPEIIDLARRLAGGGGEDEMTPEDKEWMTQKFLPNAVVPAIHGYHTSVDGRTAHLQSLILALRGDDPLSKELRAEFRLMFRETLYDTVVRKLFAEIGSETARDADVFRREVLELIEAGTSADHDQIMEKLNALALVLDDVVALAGATEATD